MVLPSHGGNTGSNPVGSANIKSPAIRRAFYIGGTYRGFEPVVRSIAPAIDDEAAQPRSPKGQNSLKAVLINPVGSAKQKKPAVAGFS